MATSKITITLENDMVERIDMLVKSNLFPNRSKAIQQAVVEKLNRIDKNRLSQECAKLDPEFEQSFSEEGFTRQLEEWSTY